MTYHEGIVGMGLMTDDDEDDNAFNDYNDDQNDDDDDHDDTEEQVQEVEAGILSSIPLCEISHYNNMGGELGIFVTLRCIGRAELQSLIQNVDGGSEKSFLMGTCIEMTDETITTTTTTTTSLLPNDNDDDDYDDDDENDDEDDDDDDDNIASSLDIANRLANRIDKTVVRLSVLEEQLSLQLEQQVQEGTLSDLIEVRNDDSDHFYSDNEDDDLPTREERYETAYAMALEADSQGYVMTKTDKSDHSLNNNINDHDDDRTIQELTAISWAVFCTELSNDLDAPYRLQALESIDLVERLELGLSILYEKQVLLESMLSPTSSSLSSDRTPPPFIGPEDDGNDNDDYDDEEDSAFA